MKIKKIENPISIVEQANQQYEDPQANLIGVLSILFEVATRTTREIYLIGYKQNND